MTVLRIEPKDNDYLINGRPYKELSVIDRELLHRFFESLKPKISAFEASRDLYVESPLTDEFVIQ